MKVDPNCAPPGAKAAPSDSREAPSPPSPVLLTQADAAKAKVDKGWKGWSQDELKAKGMKTIAPSPGTQPGPVKPTEVKPGEVKPGEVKPAVVKPGEVKPAEVKPGEVKPGEVKPAEVKPGEVKPEEKPGDKATGECYTGTLGDFRQAVSVFTFIMFQLPSHTQMLKAHNTQRAKHGAPPMTLDDAQNAKAQAWSDKMAPLKKTVFSPDMHSNEAGQGENIAFGGGLNAADPAVTMWYAEIKDYKDFKSNDQDFRKTGHFSQVVWKASTKLGVGVACAGKDYTFVTANYVEQGNMQGKYVDNVLPPAK